jgi:hypothetical protein
MEDAMKKTFGLLAVLTLSLAACGGDDDGGDEEDMGGEESIDVEGCEHLIEGPEVAVTATAETDGAPAVGDDHMRYDVTLVEVDGGNGGSVAFDADEASDFIFFLSADVDMTITDSEGAEVAIEESASSSPECEEIRGRHVAELEVGTNYLTFGPTDEAELSVVIEHADHEHEEGEEEE